MRLTINLITVEKQRTQLELAAEVASSAEVAKSTAEVTTKENVPLKEVKSEGKFFRVARPCNFNFEKLKSLPQVEVWGANTAVPFLGTSKTGVPKLFAPWNHEMVRKEVFPNVALKAAEIMKSQMTEEQQLAAFGL